MQFDLTRPNTGRMVDYWLGGDHNFEIDRQLADQVSQKFPVMRDQVLDARALLKRGVEYFCRHDIRTILDFGAGLPTCGNTHQIAHAFDPQIKIVYSDIDPITVAYGQELVQGEANVIYRQCDAANPLALFNSPSVGEFLGTARRVGIVFLALGHQMSDAQIRAAWQTLYDWSAPGSFLIASLASELWKTEPDLIAVSEAYSRSNLTGFFRTRAELRDLAQSWRVTEEGIVDYTRWGIHPPPEQPNHAIAYAMMVAK